MNTHQKFYVDLSVNGMMGGAESIVEPEKTLDQIKGDDFDKTVLKQLIEIKRQSLATLEMTLKNSAHEDLKKLVRTLKQSDLNQIESLKILQRYWGYDK